MTYPQEEVYSFLNENFECVKLDQSDTSEAERKFMLENRLLWSPGLVFMDHRENVIRSAVGYRLPAEMIAEAAMALGKVSMLHSKPDVAENWFAKACEVADDYEVAPEALYWIGVARLRSTNGNKDALWDAWEQLRREYPKSKWATSADCRDYAPE